MYRHAIGQCEFPDFHLPFGGHLNAENRWVKLARLVPWEEVERAYSKGFAGTGMGAPAKNGRIAFGALIIKERLGLAEPSACHGEAAQLLGRPQPTAAVG